MCRLALVLSLLPTLAFAQPAPSQDPPTVTLQTPLVRSVITYLQMGGTHNEGVLLSGQIVDAAQSQVRAEAQAAADRAKQAADAANKAKAAMPPAPPELPKP